MASKIEDLIDEIEEYIDNCPYKRFSNNQILVEKDAIDTLILQLRSKLPEEIKRYQRIISNKEAIIEDANQRASQIVNTAQQYTSELVNEHEITSEARMQAEAIIESAKAQAQDIVDQASAEAENLRSSAVQYLDGELAAIQTIITSAIENNQSRHESLMTTLQQHLQVVVDNRNDLRPQETYQTPDDGVDMSFAGTQPAE